VLGAGKQSRADRYCCRFRGMYKVVHDILDLRLRRLLTAGMLTDKTVGGNVGVDFAFARYVQMQESQIKYR